MTAILHEVVAQNPAERLVVCEEGARELIVPGANVGGRSGMSTTGPPKL